MSKYVFNVAFILAQLSFFNTFQAELSINHTISASTGVVLAVAQFIRLHIVDVVSSQLLVQLVFVSFVLSADVRILFVAPSTILSISKASPETLVGS